MNPLHFTALATERDLRLAIKWGFLSPESSIVLPGNGGIRLNVFYPPLTRDPMETDIIINPRGIRAYIRNDTFFQAARMVIENLPTIRFVCPGMAGDNNFSIEN